MSEKQSSNVAQLPDGWKMYDKYQIRHTDGTPLKGKKYFVLRLDSDNPAEAARVAAAMCAYKGELSEGDSAKMREASAPVPCDHVLTLDEAIAHAEECADNTPCGSQHRQLADWLKELKTLKTSVSCGNGAKMCEALVNISKYADCAAMRQHDATTQHYIEQIRKWADAALAAPPRNCDVGDADDWEKRFGEECDKGHTCSACPVRLTKTKMAIEFTKGAKCEFIWAQMPYEEGGAK